MTQVNDLVFLKEDRNTIQFLSQNLSLGDFIQAASLIIKKRPLKVVDIENDGGRLYYILKDLRTGFQVEIDQEFLIIDTVALQLIA